MRVDDLDTPVPVVARPVLERNLTRAASYAHQHGLALRPHVKTHKSLAVARHQLALGAAGLTCATPHEVRVMSAACDDLLLAYPPFGAGKLGRLLGAPASARLTVSLDSVEAADGLAAAARAARREVGVYVEADVGMHRVGVADHAAAVALARHVAGCEGLRYAGLAYYPGHIRETVQAQHDALAALTGSLAALRQALGEAGLPPAVVSGGSTPTIWRSHEVPGVTEIRPGTYVYNDRTTAEIGACAWDDCALTVLATVVSTSVAGQAVIDAGAKALGREPVRGAAGEGWAVLRDHPEVVVERMSEEHGMLSLRGSSWRPRLGQRVHVIPNHVCIVVHLNDEVAVTDDGDLVAERWPVEARGRAG